MDTNKLNSENKDIWDSNAKDWDDYMGEAGNDWHKKLIAPQTEQLLNLKRNDRLLDIGCGNGLFARRMAKKGIKVTAFDFSNLNIENAQKYDTSNINYLTLDATLESDLKKLNNRKFEGLVSNMVFMDMPDIEYIFSQIKGLLTDDGVFVFSIQHPCFNSEFAEVKDDDSLLLKDYVHRDISKGVAIPTQTKEQYYFHRPISYYMNLGFANGLVVSGFVESSFDSKTNDGVYSKFPPILIIKMIKG
ncbi:class I SAM-dependent methyltransferase [Marinifilum flexuosum]|uniref:Methyltransferase family protein n=1 Tax=Marinifilum flexuosum TaxID=1117708 RepID=A0A419WTG5_9BACT|nr:class I SAM-dependent methyltransferase [Marinifilum flexuosum]RKD98753.1 methyltransferase family protein [Marinifilum flexuosum]